MDADVLSVREAAEQLGVSSARVRQLISAGSLPARRSSAGWLIGADAVADRSGSARAGRPASPRTVWAILCILSSALAADAANPPGCMVRDRRLRHHALQLLSAMPDPADDPGRWRILLTSRGRTERMWAHPGLLSNLCSDDRISVGGDRAAAHVGEGLSRVGLCDLYVAGSDVKDIVAHYRLRPDPDGQIRLHVVPEGLPRELISGGPGIVLPAVGAADLLDEDDPRARRSALLQLSAMCAALASRRPIRAASASQAPIIRGPRGSKADGSGNAR
jgi:excisionase family DNA binding protein